MITKPRAEGPATWLLLLHQLPARPAYARVKLWRRLQALGAVAVKNAVYALPAGPQAQEDFEWVLKEIGENGGEGLIVEARLIDGLTDEAARALFSTAREADYRALAKEIRAIDKGASPAHVARLRVEAARIAAIDFFGANGREDVEARLAALSAGDTAPGLAPRLLVPGPGQVWVTRRNVHVDRIGSAWLIRRFIDPDAVFKFVSAKGYRPRKGELRFDMFDAEYTHEGDRCTFEVLLLRSGRDDPALTAIGEIVHDIDLKDNKFARVEAGGIAALIDGLAHSGLSDMQRVEQGGRLFDNLYALFSDRRR
ncbi:MAG TPA: chromate resistance protein ChrB domain-containing protein [Acetobacteraceae bacterium]|jgi:hypothetical protein|nr:chromate resistance protein ChrB domain-containing protein [Acetobacteraceae bacterium]